MRSVPCAPASTARQATWGALRPFGCRESRRRMVPSAARRRISADRNLVTEIAPFLTITSRRSRSMTHCVAIGPPAAGSATSSPVAQATHTRSVVESHATPRGAGQTARRERTVPVFGSTVTSAPPDRRATCTRPAPSSTSRPGSSPLCSAMVLRSAPADVSMTHSASRSGSEATARLPAPSPMSVPPEIGGGGTVAVTEAPNIGVGEGGRPGSGGVETTVPDPPPPKPLPVEAPLPRETLPDTESLETPQFEKSAFGCGPNVAPGVLTPEEAADTVGVGYPLEHAVRAAELAIGSASASLGRKGQERKEAKPRSPGAPMAFPLSKARARRESPCAQLTCRNESCENEGDSEASSSLDHRCQNVPTPTLESLERADAGRGRVRQDDEARVATLPGRGRGTQAGCGRKRGA